MSNFITQVINKITCHSCRILAVVTTIFVVTQANSGEIEPRSYINTPVGTNFLLAGYTYSDGGLATVISSPVKDAELKMDTGLVILSQINENHIKTGNI